MTPAPAVRYWLKCRRCLRPRRKGPPGPWRGRAAPRNMGASRYRVQCEASAVSRRGLAQSAVRIQRPPDSARHTVFCDRASRSVGPSDTHDALPRSPRAAATSRRRRDERGWPPRAEPRGCASALVTTDATPAPYVRSARYAAIGMTRLQLSRRAPHPDAARRRGCRRVARRTAVPTRLGQWRVPPRDTGVSPVDEERGAMRFQPSSEPSLWQRDDYYCRFPRYRL